MQHVSGLSSEHAPRRPRIPGQTCFGGSGSACGKLIVAGEHAVVYGKHALAVPIPLAMQCCVASVQSDARRVRAASWGVTQYVSLEAAPAPLRACVERVCLLLGLSDIGFDLDILPHVPRGSGMGGSAALAVACTRALAASFKVEIKNDQVNAIGFACEELAHGRPSGVDNTVATFGSPILFRKVPQLMETVPLKVPLTFVVGQSGKPGLTLPMVAKVAQLRGEKP